MYDENLYEDGVETTWLSKKDFLKFFESDVFSDYFENVCDKKEGPIIMHKGLEALYQHWQDYPNDSVSYRLEQYLEDHGAYDNF